MADELKNASDMADIQSSENIYANVRGYIIHAQRQVHSAVNAAMVGAYWNIGKTIYDACGEIDRAACGMQILKYLSMRLTEEFERGFDESNLRNMRRFYLAFPIRGTLCPELSWSHYRLLIRRTLRIRLKKGKNACKIRDNMLYFEKDEYVSLVLRAGHPLSNLFI